MERQGLQQLFYVTHCDRSPNLLSRDACYTLGVLKPCYTVEKQLGFSESSTDSTQSQVTPIHASKGDDFPTKSFLHQKMKETERKLSNNSTKHSISKEQLQGGPLTKQDIDKWGFGLLKVVCRMYSMNLVCLASERFVWFYGWNPYLYGLTSITRM